MSQIHRPWPRRGHSITIDVRLLEEMEELARMEEAPPPAVIAPLMRRLEATRAPWPAGVPDQTLDSCTYTVLGGWMDLEEVYVMQRLRGWNRARRGTIVVEACWLTATRNLMDDFTYTVGERCEDEIEELRNEGQQAGDLLAQALTRMAGPDTCGECDHCRALDLRDECDRILDAAGFDGGVYYYAYVRGETQAQLAARYGWAA